MVYTTLENKKKLQETLGQEDTKNIVTGTGVWAREKDSWRFCSIQRRR